MNQDQNSIELLKIAANGEFNAIQKYQAFSKIAEEEGLPNIALLFKSLVIGEQIHLKNHMQALKLQGIEFLPVKQDFKLGTTFENLKTAFETELWEYNNLYKNLIKKIQKSKKYEEVEAAKLSFKWAKEVEKSHAEVIKMAIDDLQQQKDFHINKFWVCKVCGNLFISESGDRPIEVCPVCKHDIYFYIKVQKNQIGV